MKNADLQPIPSSLSTAHRAELAQELGQSAARDAQAQGPIERERSEIALRRAEHRADPQSVVPWSQVKTSLKL